METAAQPGGFKIPDFFPAQRGNGGAAGWLQDSGLGAVMGANCPLFWALDLCFVYTFVLVFILELEKSEKRRDVIVE